MDTVVLMVSSAKSKFSKLVTNIGDNDKERCEFRYLKSYILAVVYRSTM